MACNELFPRLRVDVKVFVEEEEEEFDDREDDQDKQSTAAVEEADDVKDEQSPVVATSSSSSSNSKAVNMKKYLNMVRQQATISGDKVYENDLVSLKLTITRENVPEVRTNLN